MNYFVLREVKHPRNAPRDAEGTAASAAAADLHRTWQRRVQASAVTSDERVTHEPETGGDEMACVR